MMTTNFDLVLAIFVAMSEVQNDLVLIKRESLQEAFGDRPSETHDARVQVRRIDICLYSLFTINGNLHIYISF